jgi:hypothetical protein
MKKSIIPVFFLICTLLLTSTKIQASDGDSVQIMQSVRTYRQTDFLPYGETHPSPLLPNYAWGQTKSFIRLTQNPYVSFDGKVVKSEPWPRVIGLQYANETQVEYVQNYEAGQRRLLESLPIAPYLHFQNKNTSAGLLVWFGGRVNFFVRTEW